MKCAPFACNAVAGTRMQRSSRHGAVIFAHHFKAGGCLIHPRNIKPLLFKTSLSLTSFQLLKAINSGSFTARDFTASQQEGSEESLEINGSISYSVSTCRTAELYSNAGYLQSVRGNCIHVSDFDVIVKGGGGGGGGGVSPCFF